MPKSKSALKFIKNTNVTKFLTCPLCFTSSESTLRYHGKYFKCKTCKRKYTVKNHIIELINPTTLSKQVLEELEGNKIPLTKKNIERFARKDKWSDYYNHFVSQKIGFLMNELKKSSYEGLVSLGSGPGFEIKEVLKRKRFPTVFSSDLAFTATSIVPYTLKNYEITLCLFTSDLNYVPVLPNKNFPILIYEALHHTKSSTKTVGLMMKKNYSDIFFVEPCTNFLIKILARLGLAQRVEYSGVHPDFVDLTMIKNMADKYKYRYTINTIWDVPEEYIRHICKKGSVGESIILKIIDFISFSGNLFDFGSFAIVHLYKND